jgi:glycosyltransferase involved in cell wall biosynthesis
MLKTINFYIKYPTILRDNIITRIKSLIVVKTYDLVVLDDVFPNKLSAWRFEEFTEYIKHFDDKICVFSSGHSLGALYDSRSIKENIQEFKAENPNLKNNLKQYNYHRKVKAKLGYCLFIHNAFNFLNYFEKNNISFVFTLYPGAGFLLNQPETDSMLKKVLSSKLFRGVITTQKITSEYLIEKQFCDQSKIHFIYGVVAPKMFLASDETLKRYFINDRMNVCFVANKQMDRGVDKGYDVFIEMAKIVSQLTDKVSFNVVGPFSKEDIDLESVEDRVKFHGFVKSTDLPAFFLHQDLIVSPNKPFVLKPGAFDGFPTASCSEAALNGVAMLVTDPLNQNIYFQHGENIIIEQPDPILISEKIMFYLKNPEILRKIGIEGQKSAKEIYATDKQIKERISYLKEHLK